MQAPSKALVLRHSLSHFETASRVRTAEIYNTCFPSLYEFQSAFFFFFFFLNEATK